MYELRFSAKAWWSAILTIVLFVASPIAAPILLVGGPDQFERVGVVFFFIALVFVMAFMLGWFWGMARIALAPRVPAFRFHKSGVFYCLDPWNTGFAPIETISRVLIIRDRFELPHAPFMDRRRPRISKPVPLLCIEFANWEIPLKLPSSFDAQGFMKKKMRAEPGMFVMPLTDMDVAPEDALRSLQDLYAGIAPVEGRMQAKD